MSKEELQKNSEKALNDIAGRLASLFLDFLEDKKEDVESSMEEVKLQD